MEKEKETTCIAIEVSGIQLSKMKVAHLKALLEVRGLETGGKKLYLMKRLERVLQERVLEVSS